MAIKKIKRLAGIGVTSIFRTLVFSRDLCAEIPLDIVPNPENLSGHGEHHLCGLRLSDGGGQGRR